jgi:Fn3-like domain/FlgD Ig-like domain
MACPLAAAVYALIINARGTKDPKTIENLLSSTAKPNLFRRDGVSPGFLAPVVQQGAGLIQAWDAAQATTLLSVSSISFNDTDHLNAKQEFTISNTGKSAVTYSLSNVGAGTAWTFQNAASTEPAPLASVELTNDFASLAFSQSTVTIPAGQRKIVSVTVTPPKIDGSRLPVYSGYIAINGSDSSALSLPYLGVVGSLHNRPVLDKRETLLSRAKDSMNTPVPANITFVIPPAGFSNDTSYRNRTELPKIVITLGFGSPLVRVDVVPLTNCSLAARSAATVFGTKTLGQPEGFPVYYNPRGTLEFSWDGKLADGNYAPSGQYKLAVRALRVYGDEKKAEEYDVTETVAFRIRYAKQGGKRRGLYGVTTVAEDVIESRQVDEQCEPDEKSVKL